MGKPEKRVVISRKNAYHGSTVAASSLGGMKEMHQQTVMVPDIVHVEQPHWFARRVELGADLDRDEFGRQAAQSIADKIEELGADKVAAFIAEPIQGAGGVIVPPETYWPEVRKICDTLRHPAHRRRGHLRFRPYRRMVRYRLLRSESRPDADCQGPVFGLPADRRRHDFGSHDGGAQQGR